MIRNVRLGLIAAIILAAPGVAMAEGGADARKLVAEANRAYHAGDVAQALEGYKQAEVTMPESPELAYNRAAAHYKLGQYVEAREYFNRSLATRDLSLEAKAKFNLGNVAYASAMEKLASLKEAIDLLKGAIGHYQDALEINPQDGDARANIEMAQLVIKDLLDKLKKQQQEQQQEGQDQEQEDESQQDQQQRGEDQQDEKQQGDQPQDQQEGDQEQKHQQPEAHDQDEQQQPQQAEGEMTKDEAERLLQSVRDRERQRREEQAQRRRRAPRRRVIKDW